MKFHILPSAEELNRILFYCPATGEFRWRVNQGTAAAGSIAGCLGPQGYRSVKISRRLYYAHRLAWKMMHDEDPDEQIDHINGIKDDNRLANLRQATHAENQRNTCRRSNNESGVKGVRLRTGGWDARIRAHGRSNYLGFFKDIDSAAAAYRAASALHYGEFANHG